MTEPSKEALIAQAEALEEMADKCTESYATGNGWGIARADLRCEKLLTEKASDLRTQAASLSSQPKQEPMAKLTAMLAHQTVNGRRLELYARQLSDVISHLPEGLEGDLEMLDEPLSEMRAALKELDAHRTTDQAALRAQSQASGPFVRFGEMMESNGRVTWTVELARTENASMFDCHQVYSSTIKGRAEYERDSLLHFLGQGPAPDMLAYDTDPPAQSQAEEEEKPVAFAWLYSTNSGDWLSLLPPDQAAKTWRINNAIPLYTNPAPEVPSEVMEALRDARELLALTFPEDFCRDGCDECGGDIEDCPGNCPVRTAPPLVERLSAILATQAVKP